MNTLKDVRERILQLRGRGHSWRRVSQWFEEYAGVHGISHATYQDIGEGRDVSPETLRKLRVRKGDRIRGTVEYGYGREGRERREQIREALREQGYGSLTELIDSLFPPLE